MQLEGLYTNCQHAIHKCNIKTKKPKSCKMLLKVLKYLLISKNACVSRFSVLPASNRENKTQWSNDTCAILCCLVFA